ncbi:hypothetical protein BFR04_03650 [Gaetbulibacter sp. 4G1]|nr:hypothetical protein BFR04_03650 [Gaetbulibacter sp. 4G1]
MNNLGFGSSILNFFGAITRYSYGLIWRTIFRKPKFTFNEYLYGPKNSDNYFDQTAHVFNNKIIGLICIGVLIFLLMKFT